jgi:hypothetical protein
MRCLDHVFLRGAMAVALLAFGGTGALLLPPTATPACTTKAAAAPVAVSMASVDTARAIRTQFVVARIERPSC